VEGMQSFALNLRRAKFQDVRVRKALNYAFDFEWANANLFYGQYTRSRELFSTIQNGSKRAASPEELELLEPLRDQLPAEVFTTEYTNPVSSNSTDRRKNLREASKLLAEAGWNVTQDGNKSILEKCSGRKTEVEFLLDSPTFERVACPTSNNWNCWVSASDQDGRWGPI
jgi:microcin C transport system substrate-binding protein